MKAAIYLRTSTLEQHPEKQRAECETFCKMRGYEVEGAYEEYVSGWKQVERPQYALVKEKARCGQIQAVVVWAIDRWVRNRDTLMEDVMILGNYGCKLHSVKDSWVESINIEGALGKTLREFLLGLVGSLAEMESARKSERVKMAYAAHKGARWGRPALKDNVKQEVRDLRQQGLSIGQICKRVTYWDRSGHKQPISRAAVHKIIHESSIAEPSPHVQ